MSWFLSINRIPFPSQSFIYSNFQAISLRTEFIAKVNAAILFIVRALHKNRAVTLKSGSDIVYISEYFNDVRIGLNCSSECKTRDETNVSPLMAVTFASHSGGYGFDSQPGILTKVFLYASSISLRKYSYHQKSDNHLCLYRTCS
jgi:hypothetical protein